MAITEAGERLLDILQPALTGIDERLPDLTEYRERPAGTIRISTLEHAAETVLWPAVDKLISGHPDINIERLVAFGSVIVGWTMAKVVGRLIRRVEDAASATVLQFVTTFGVWLLAERLHLSEVITIVTFGLTAARAPRPGHFNGANVIGVVLSKPYVIAPILGTTAIKHVEEAVAALDIQLSDEEIQALEKPYVTHPVLRHVGSYAIGHRSCPMRAQRPDAIASVAIGSAQARLRHLDLHSAPSIGVAADAPLHHR